MTFTNRYQTSLLFSFWLLVQIGLFFVYGVNPTLESLKYISAANDLITKGHLPETRYFFYLNTTLIIAFCLKTGLGYGGVVVIQLLVNLAATFTFFEALQRRQAKTYPAFLTTLLLISFLPYQTWNFYLYTESIFYSCALLFFASCIRFPEIGQRAIVTQGFFLLLTILSRPLGIIFLPCWVLFIAIKRKIHRVIIALSLVISMIAAIMVANTIMSTIGDWQILRPAEFGYVICDIPSRSKLNLDKLKQYAPLTQLGLFALQYPAEFLTLSVKRVAAFFLLTRSYYNKVHNLYLIIYAALFSVPFLWSLFYNRENQFLKAAFYLSFLIVAGFTLAIALQCDDYHNRFHHTLVPIFLFGGFFLVLDKRNHFNRQKK